ncbi:MAG: hypothetical protein QM786_06790 [Breznakibacter sp.]
MNRFILLAISCFISVYSAIAQVNYTKSHKENDFAQFLNQFLIVGFPFNYKIELSRISKEGKTLKYISFQDAESFLGMGNQDLFTNRLMYDYETFEKSYLKEENLPAAHLMFATKNYIATIYRHSQGIDSDTVYVYLGLFTKKGVLIDKKLIGEQFTREDDWISSVFLDEHHFKVFRYALNLENYEILNNIYHIIDNKQAMTTVVVEDYKIDESGKIEMIEKYPKRYLKEDISAYKVFNQNTDDPMNDFQ